MATAVDLLPSAPEVQVRPMTEPDLPLIASIERESYHFPWGEGIFRDCLRVGYICRVATVNAKVVAYAVMSIGAGEAHILNICTHESWRCRGIARHMLGYLLDRAAIAGMLDAFLEVRPTNTSAIRLYNSLGFEQVGVRRGYYQAANGREDAAVLRLSLRGRAAQR
jgi:ribosomal-protein-alanine N-acetyltransferase